MCALECPEYFAEMRDLGKVNGSDIYEVRVVRRPCTPELDDDQRPLTPLEVLAGPVRVRDVYLPASTSVHGTGSPAKAGASPACGNGTGTTGSTGPT